MLGPAGLHLGPQGIQGGQGRIGRQRLHGPEALPGRRLGCPAQLLQAARLAVQAELEAELKMAGVGWYYYYKLMIS